MKKLKNINFFVISKVFFVNYQKKFEKCLFFVHLWKLTRGDQNIWVAKLQSIFIDVFDMLKKHPRYPPFIPTCLLDLETQGSML